MSFSKYETKSNGWATEQGPHAYEQYRNPAIGHSHLVLYRLWTPDFVPQIKGQESGRRQDSEGDPYSRTGVQNPPAISTGKIRQHRVPDYPASDHRR